MEASIGVPAYPLAGRKVPRRHYKAEFEKVCAYADELVTDLHQAIVSRNDAERGYKGTCESLAIAEASRYNWMRAAVIEGLLLAIALVVWLAR